LYCSRSGHSGITFFIFKIKSTHKKPRKVIPKRFLKKVHNYANDLPILYELIQNADNAGASEIKIIYDPTSYSLISLFDSTLKEYCGPAIYFYSNSLFGESDFSSLCYGLSSKTNNPAVIGSKGTGFSAVFHVTDFPIIISGEFMTFVEPTGRLFSQCSPTDPCVRINWTTNSIVSYFPDQFKPFMLNNLGIFDFTTSTSYPGTLIRLPLRTKKELMCPTVKNK